MIKICVVCGKKFEGLRTSEIKAKGKIKKVVCK